MIIARNSKEYNLIRVSTNLTEFNSHKEREREPAIVLLLPSKTAVVDDGRPVDGGGRRTDGENIIITFTMMLSCDRTRI